METAAATSPNIPVPVISVRGLTFTYPKASQPAVRGMDFAVGRGEIFGFLGPSGAGKSTTQKLLIGLLRGHGGEATVWGKDPLAWGPDYYQRIGVSFELPNHYQKLTGLENLRFFASLYDGETLDPMQLLDAVGLGDDANTRVGKYSKGMQMRLTFIRSLINDPELLFLDEPTSGLDPVNARKVKDIVLDLKARGRTIFLTTHDMATADELCDRVAFVVDGQIVALDTPAELKIARSQRLRARRVPRRQRAAWRRPSSRWTAWPMTRHSMRCCERTMSRPSTAGRPASTTSSSRSPEGGCHDPAGKCVAARGDAAGQAEVPARGDLLRADLAGGSAADAAQPASRRRALRPARRHCIIGFFFVAGTVFFEKQERTLGAVDLHAAAVLGVSVRQTDCARVDFAVRRGRGAHDRPRVRLPSCSVGGRRGARHVADAAGRIHHRRLPFASISDWFLARDDPARGHDRCRRSCTTRACGRTRCCTSIPTQGPMLLLGTAFDQVALAPWQAVYAVAVSGRCA